MLLGDKPAAPAHAENQARPAQIAQTKTGIVKPGSINIDVG